MQDDAVAPGPGRDSGRFRTRDNGVAQARIGHDQFEPVQPSHARGSLARPAAVPTVPGNLVVVSARPEEAAAGIAAGHVEAEQIAR